MSRPLVSVIMAVYNCEKFIKESLYSMKNQDFKDFEIILYDDGSTDKTYRIAEEILYSSGIRYSMGKSLTGDNVGCGQARNKAIEFAGGKYLAIQDGDDRSLPHRLRKEVEFLEENLHVFCVSALASVMDERGKHLEFYTYPPVTHNNIKMDMLEKKINPIIDPASMFRRDIFEKLGGYDSKWKLVPDFNLWMRAMLEGYEFANIGDFLIHYRKHENSNTTKYKKEAIREHFKMCEEMLSEHKKRFSQVIVE
jgi:glycosyltransferase EpsE